jgi:FkbM family methyltransferase
VWKDGGTVLFPNVRLVFRWQHPLSSFKLMLAAACSSRPGWKSLWFALLRPFVRDGQFAVRYELYGKPLKAFLRMEDLRADFLSFKELGLSDVYRLEASFHPDLVIDGGGNTGLFTLQVAAAAEVAGFKPKIKVCEPLPRNVEQIQRHLRDNSVEAEVLPCCLGGERTTIDFYCRGANQSSFDATEPYDSVMVMQVLPLAEVTASQDAERILVKLDIEGMEVEVLRAFVPAEHRAVYVVGELHDVPVNGSKMEEIFSASGWVYEPFDVDVLTASFRACSPAAAPLLPWALGKVAVAASSV